MNLNKFYLSKMQLVLLAICFVGFIGSNQAQRGSQRFLQPEIDYSPWSPIDTAETPLEVKTNKVRSIQSSAPEPLFVPKTKSIQSRRKVARDDEGKGAKRRNFEDTIESKSDEKVTTTRTTYSRRRPTTTKTVAVPVEKNDATTNRFKVPRRPTKSTLSPSTKSTQSSSIKTTQYTPSTTAKSHRQFTARSTSENVLVSTSEAPSSTKPSLKRIPFTRGNFRPKTSEKSVDGNSSSEDENYPEHFKLLLKTKEVDNENDKSALKKLVKPNRPSSVEKTTKASVRTASKSNVLYPTRSRGLARTTSTTELPPSTSSPLKKMLRRPKPTERTKTSVGSTLQEPPTAKSTPTYATRSPSRQSIEESVNVNTQSDPVKQIDPPKHEYFPRTSAIGSSLKYSSRFRNSDVALKANKGSYQPTVPSITMAPMPDLSDIDLERWREFLPLAAELVQTSVDAEIMTQSPSHTVSIYEALAEILSKPTESLTFSNSKSTDRTLMSEAPISSTTSTTTTTTTTTSTTPLPPSTTEENKDDLKENTSLIIDALQKLKNETESLVKSENIFSLAKKIHGHDMAQLEIDPVNNQIGSKTDEKPKTSTTVQETITSTPIPTSTTTTTLRTTEVTKDFLDNEILDELEEKFERSSAPNFKLPAVEISNIVETSSEQSEDFVPLTLNDLLNSEIETTSKVLRTSSTTTQSVEETTKTPATTTENVISKNFKILQSLLGATNSKEVVETTKPSRSNEVPHTTENFIAVNYKKLQNILGAPISKEVVKPSEPSKSFEIPQTTEDFVAANYKKLQSLLGATNFNEVFKASERSTSAEIPTTEDFIAGNYKKLQNLLGATNSNDSVKARDSSISTEIPQTTEDFIAANYKKLQSLLESSSSETFEPSTSTENFIATNYKKLQELLATQISRNEKSATFKTTNTETSRIEAPTTSTFVFESSTTDRSTDFPKLTSTPSSSIQSFTKKSSKKVSTTTPATTTQRTLSTTTSQRKKSSTTTTPTTTSTKSTLRTTSTTTTPSTIPSTTPTPLTTPSTLMTTITKTSATSLRTKISQETSQKARPKAPFSDAEDLEFLQQLAGFINGRSPNLLPTKTSPKSTTASTSTSTTTATSTTTSTTSTTTTTTTTPKPSTTSRIISTTSRILSSTRIPTTFSDADDVAFLNSLRQYANIINLTTERSPIANKILELALNRSGKSVPAKPTPNNQIDSTKPSVQTTPSPEDVVKQISETRENINMMNGILKNQEESPSKKLSPSQVERTKQMLQKDISQYNSDIKLLSLLVGKQITNDDIAKLANTNLGRVNSVRSVGVTPTQSTTTVAPSSTMKFSQLPLPESSIPPFKPLSPKETQFLQALEQIQTTKTTTTTTTTERMKTVSKSQEAIIAALLKQQGIGPTNNKQVDIEKILEQLPLNSINQIATFSTTTVRPFSPLPPLRRQPRPILDGLAWLWQQWQETAPGPAPTRTRKQRPQTTVVQESFNTASQPSQGLGIDWRASGATQNTEVSSEAEGFSVQEPPLIPSGLLGAALGVTRAVTQFLGVALAGAGQAFQTAFTGGSVGPAVGPSSAGNNYYAFSGR